MKKNYQKPSILKATEERGIVPLAFAAGAVVGYAAVKGVSKMMQDFTPNGLKKLEKVEVLKYV